MNIHDQVQARRGNRRRAAGVGLAALALLTAATGAAVAQRGGFGPPMGQERKLVAQFDRNGDKRLDAEERKAAREWLATQPATGFGGRGGFGRGGPPTPVVSGRKLAPADVKAYPATVPLYDKGTIRTLFLQFDGSDWDQELAAFNNTDVEVPATAVVDGRTL